MHFEVVILGMADDPHVSSVVGHLAVRGVSTACVDQVSLWRDTVTFNPAKPKLHVGEQSISGCSLVWNRRIYHPAIDTISVGDRKFARMEFTHTLFGALSALTTCWFNTPESIRRASYKAAQLKRAAADSRLRIPRTMITSNEDHVRQFIGNQQFKYIMKPLARPMIEVEEGLAFLHTTLVDERILESLPDIKNAPCIVQEFIDRQYEVRVNVIGDRIFATRLDTSHMPGTEADARCVPDYHDIVHSVVEVPPAIAAACADMCAYFGLRFGAFDFGVDKNGNWIFFEVNPNGQWYWIEEMTGQALSSAMADEICRAIRH